VNKLIELLAARFSERAPIIWARERWQERNFGLALVLGPNERVEHITAPQPDPIFPLFRAASISSLLEYLKRHADPSATAVMVGSMEIKALMNFCDEMRPRRPDDCTWRAALTADWDPQCRSFMNALEEAMKKPQNLDQMERLLDLGAPFVARVAEISGTLADLEGVEMVGCRRTGNGIELNYGAGVKPRGDRALPAALDISVQFLGFSCRLLVPLRASVKAGQIAFELVDNGSITIARREALRAAVGLISSEGWSVFEGTV